MLAAASRRTPEDRPLTLIPTPTLTLTLKTPTPSPTLTLTLTPTLIVILTNPNPKQIYPKIPLGAHDLPEEIGRRSRSRFGLGLLGDFSGNCKRFTTRNWRLVEP